VEETVRRVSEERNKQNMTENLVDALALTNDTSEVVNLYLLLFLIALIPSFLVLTTSFTRTIIVLSFTRNALGTQQSPPNQVLIGLALFLSVFVMRPVYQEVNEQALQPMLAGEITREESLDIAEEPIKTFMLEQTRTTDLELFVQLSGDDFPEDPEDLSLFTVIPAFAISELRTAFTIGFLIFIPFLVIDIVVASILMSMGMFMLSPVMISLPFKLLLFVMVDGWYLVVESLIGSFY
jgi:flagellar biosynthetic protein FliP